MEGGRDSLEVLPSKTARRATAGPEETPVAVFGGPGDLGGEGG